VPELPQNNKNREYVERDRQLDRSGCGKERQIDGEATTEN